MRDLWRGQPIDRLPPAPYCPWCGSKHTSARGSGKYACHRCFRPFGDVAEVPFDFIADELTGTLARLQATGEVIAVRLGGGFYGVCLLAVESPLVSTLRELRRGKLLRGGGGRRSPRGL